MADKMTLEKWEPVPGFPGYAMTSEGRVRGRRKELKAFRNGTHGRAYNLYVDGEPVRVTVRALITSLTLRAIDDTDSKHYSTDGFPGINPMTKRIRRLPKERKQELLQVALALAERHGYLNVSRAAIAAKCGVSESLLSHYFGTMPQFRRTLMRYAVEQESLLVVAQGLITRSPHALKASDDLKARACAWLAP